MIGNGWLFNVNLCDVRAILRIKKPTVTQHKVLSKSVFAWLICSHIGLMCTTTIELKGAGAFRLLSLLL